MNVMLRDYREYEKNTLKAFVTIEILDIHLVIKDCTVHQKDGRAWIGFPGRKYIDGDGNEAWTNILEFKDDAAREDFRKAAVSAVKDHVESLRKRESRPKDDETTPF